MEPSTPQADDNCKNECGNNAALALAQAQTTSTPKQKAQEPTQKKKQQEPYKSSEADQHTIQLGIQGLTMTHPVALHTCGIGPQPLPRLQPAAIWVPPSAARKEFEQHWSIHQNPCERLCSSTLTHIHKIPVSPGVCRSESTHTFSSLTTVTQELHKSIIALHKDVTADRKHDSDLYEVGATPWIVTKGVAKGVAIRSLQSGLIIGQVVR